MIAESPDKARAYWEFWADDAKRAGSKLYSQLASRTANDAELKAIAAHAAPGQPHANMLFAAVHFLILRGAEHPLKQLYRDAAHADFDRDDAFPVFRDFVLVHREALVPLIETRVTNTNEVGRSAVLHAGFRAAAGTFGEPLHLVEIGPSAGLNLIWDEYGVRYLREGRIVLEVLPQARLMLDCELRGQKLPAGGPAPEVAQRVGLELNPVDPDCADDVDWLRALIWPDQEDRRAQFERAFGLLKIRRPEIRRGDALALLTDALAEVPNARHLCVFHTIALYQLSAAMKEALHDTLIAISLRRPLSRLSLEYKGIEARLVLTRYAGGICSERLLAISHPHGRWLEWRA